MADIKLKIEVNPNAETETLGDISTINEISNTSFKVDEKGVYFGILKDKINGANKLSLAQPLVFDSNGYLINKDDSVAGVVGDEQNPDQFVWGAVPDNKELHIKLIFTKAQSLKDIVVYGDNVSNQFPTRAIVDGNIIIESDDARWAINMQTESDTHTIEFTHWNRANYNACLTGISVMLKYYEIGKFNGLKSVNSLSQSSGQEGEIFYGAISSSGDINIIDIDGEIAELIDTDIIKSNNMNLEIFCGKNQIQHHILNNNKYNINSKILTGEISNEIDNFDNIILEGRNANYTSGASYYTNLYDIATFCLLNLENTSQAFGSYIVRWDNKKESVRNYLSNITSKILYSSTTTTKDLINKVCSIAQLNLIERDNGDLKFVSARPVRLSTDTAIIIPKSMQYSPLDIPLFSYNKYNNVKYTKRNLLPNFEEVINIKFDYDENGNVVLNSGDVENAQITTDISGNPTVTFFKTIFNNGEFARYGDYYYELKRASVLITNNYESSSSTYNRNINTSIDTKDNYKFDYDITRLTIYSSPSSELFAFKINLPRADNNPKSTEIAVFGKVYYLNEAETQYNDIQDNIYNLNSDNELLTSDLYYIDETVINKPMYDIISQNIINDYKNGIRNINMTIACGDYLSTNFGDSIDWTNNQEVVQVGDVVRIDKDNNGTPLSYKDGRPMYWKVIGRDFRYGGVPMIDLQLQEVVTIEQNNE